MYTDAAKEAKRLLDIISEAKHISVALSEFKNKRSNILTTRDVQELELLIEALEYIEDKGRQQTTKVSVCSHLLRAYDMRKKMDRGDEQCPKKSSVSESMWRIKKFIWKCKNNLLRVDDVQIVKNPLSPSTNANRQSNRIANTITPERQKEALLKEFDGQPPYPDKMWSKTKLIAEEGSY